jgi:hypothetical protein
MQAVIVAVIVVLAACYATWRLLPQSVRARLASRVVGFLRARGRLSDDEAIALSRRMTAGACGSCDSRGSCARKQSALPPASVLRHVPEPPRDDCAADAAHSRGMRT